MNKKVLLAALVAGIAGFLVGWIIYGFILMDFMQANTKFFEGLFKNQEEVSLLALFFGNLLWGILFTYAYNRFSGEKSLVGGATFGVIFGLLVAGGIDLFFFATTNLYTVTYIVVDVIVTGFIGAIVGGSVGLILKTKKA